MGDSNLPSKKSGIGEINDQRKIKFGREEKGGVKLSDRANAAVRTAESVNSFLQTTAATSCRGEGSTCLMQLVELIIATGAHPSYHFSTVPLHQYCNSLSLRSYNRNKQIFDAILF